MAKRKRPAVAPPKSSSKLQLTLWLVALTAIVLLLGWPNGGSTWTLIREFVSGTATPTVTPTPTPAPTATSTATATATATPPPVEATAPAADSAPTGSVPTFTYRVVQTYPHDPKAFTQGLIFEDGLFYEGTGLRGQSTLRKVAVESGQVLQQIDLAPEYFGEGITVFGDKLYQLTWQSNLGFVYDKESFERLQEFSYPTEGWGLTHDGQQLIMSDGTATLYFLNPATLERTGQVEVRYQGGPLTQLNELEYINGEVYANVWRTNTIARIDPASGQVTGLIDLTGLLDPTTVTEPVDVLNGIAYDPATDRLFVTGKWWPRLFEIELIPQN